MTATAVVDMSRLGRFQDMTRMADEDEDPTLLKGIRYPGKHDVMLGRGGESTYHCGNIAFRQLVEEHKTKYYTAPRASKSRVVAEVVRKWRQLTPPGRFLTRTSPRGGGSSGDNDPSSWEDVGDRRALKKASHSLRDAVRCFSIEKKQQQQKQQQDNNSTQQCGSSESSKEGGRSSSAKSVSDEDELEPTMSVHHHPMMENHRKRGRVMGEPEFALSNNQSKKHFDVAQPVVVVLASASAPERRPTKMRRVVCDEREESPHDCRREGADDDDDDYEGGRGRCGGGGDEDHDGGRDDGARDNDDCCRDDSRSVSSYSSSSMSIPTAISWGQPPAEAAAATTAIAKQTLLTSHFTTWNAIAGRPHSTNDSNGLLNLSASHRLETNPSPCGSADWFAQGTEDLPVRGATFGLPAAAVLVNEVVHVPDRTGAAAAAAATQNNNEAADDDSLGWFADVELQQGNNKNERGRGGGEMARFTSKMPALVDGSLAAVHRPVAVRNNNNNSGCLNNVGREL